MTPDPLDNAKTIIRNAKPGGYTLADGQTLGQYRIIRPLGRGGMGEVYEVEHQVLRRRYALKLLPADFATQPGALARFEREAQVMANLEHPNIIRVDEFGEIGGRYWLRMELAQGADTGNLKLETGGSGGAGNLKQETGNSQKPVVSLQDLAEAKGGRIPQEELVGILKQILEGLAYAHAHGAIHRDLKPSNILLFSGRANRPGEPGFSVGHGADVAGSAPAPYHVKIADFGLVRLVGEEWVRSQAQISVQRSMDLRQGYGPQVSIGDARTMQREPDEGTSTRSMLGTYEYMSPEQKRGEEATAQSDLYAVGLMSFKLLTGQNPGLKPPSRIDKELAAEWDDLLERALEEQANSRWPDANGMLAVLIELWEMLNKQNSSVCKKLQNCDILDAKAINPGSISPTKVRKQISLCNLSPTKRIWLPSIGWGAGLFIGLAVAGSETVAIQCGQYAIVVGCSLALGIAGRFFGIYMYNGYKQNRNKVKIYILSYLIIGALMGIITYGSDSLQLSKVYKVLGYEPNNIAILIPTVIIISVLIGILLGAVSVFCFWNNLSSAKPYAIKRLVLSHMLVIPMILVGMIIGELPPGIQSPFIYAISCGLAGIILGIFIERICRPVATLIGNVTAN